MTPLHAAAAAESMSLDLAHLDVLLVEPSPTQLKIVRERCACLGIRHLREADGVQSALAVMRRKAPDVVISALYLPDGDGTDLVHAMRAMPALQQVAFVLVSSETRPQALEAVRQSGVCGILPKPFEVGQLRHVLDATLEFLAEAGMDDMDIDFGALRVLLVDDSRNARHFIRRVLENLGLRHFVEAENGREAVAHLDSTMFDLIVTDYNMPEMDGLALVEYVRRQSWQATVPILMVTSESDQGRLAAVEQSGVSGICDKPFEPSVIRGLLRQALQQAA
jgi:two-component system chemotaxis response regulator CheY